ncbi:MAG: ATP-binding protein [Fibrobacteria bacterium]
MLKLTGQEKGGAHPPPAASLESARHRQGPMETLGMAAEGVVHDFNNILATISGFAELILDTEPSGRGKRDRVREFARSILMATDTALSTIRDLRVLARQHGKEMESLDLHEILRQAVSMTRGALGGRISIKSELLPGAAEIEGCRWLLHNVFLNLFFNARDAMPAGGIISVKTARQASVAGLPDFMVVSVFDTGVGMTEAVKARAFEAYFTTKAGGSGMGLANVAATVKDHGGMIAVESTPGKGCEFRLHFPLRNTPAVTRK